MAQHNRNLAPIPQILRRLARDTRGNTYFMVAAAMLPLIGMAGSGVDIGRAYMADLRLQQACDAGVLAGRRIMTGTTYTDAHKAQATKMFNFNYQPGTYGSTTIAFNSVQDGPSNVKGTATAVMPTTLMKVFGQNQFNLSTTCTAKLEISNVDVMLVLDVTGSMNTTNSGDSVNRITALKTATMNFFDTLMTAAVGDGRIRFGVVPYNLNVNVGPVLMAKNANWLNDEVSLPSRQPLFTKTWGTGTTTYGTPYDGPITAPAWPTTGGSSQNGVNEADCAALTPPEDPPQEDGNATRVQVDQYEDSNGNQVTTSNDVQNFKVKQYRYAWATANNGNNLRCRLQSRNATFTRTTPVTVTQPPVNAFSGNYRYEDRVFNVTNAKTGGTVTANVGDEGVNVSASWSGCIIERQTVPFASSSNVPPAAFDMDIDMMPTADEDTRWNLQMGHLSFNRGGAGPDTSSDDRNSYGSNSCPPVAMKLTAMTAADRATFNTYIQALPTTGNTYHDAGMTWGARLLSPTGIFADENTTAPNGRPIQRHLIFMTDGEMVTNRDNLSFQGHEQTMQRVGSTSNSNGNERHTNRFLQICASLKSKNVTLWTIDFDATATASLVSCASGADKAFTAANAAALNTQFQAIARQIARLRIHE